MLHISAIITEPIKNVHVRVEGYPGYSVAPHDKYRETKCIERHKSSEDWTDYMSVGALSRYMIGHIKSLTLLLITIHKGCTVKV